MYDVLIIGGGPAGATAALYAARARLKTLSVAKSLTGGALGITGKIANYPGVSEQITGPELLKRMQDHAALFGAQFLQTQVYGVDVDGEVKQAYTAAGLLKGKTLIVCTGAGERANKLPGEDAYLGRGVSYCATCDGAFFADQEIAVVGNTEEAVEEALFLTKFARTLHFVTSTAKVQADPHEVERLAQSPKVKMRLRTSAKAVVGNGAVAGLRVLARGSKEEETIPVEGVFIYLPGNKPATEFLGGAVQLSPDGHIVTGPDMSTNVPGVFAAGDVRGSDLQQAVIACSDGCIAAMAADRYINKRKSLASQW
ncbi:MAG: FAD-dependent oxidoreductase [Chloroflexi bacterium]|nr:FAD-dependent oxidoreductase [Chloroflexota bacterium]